MKKKIQTTKTPTAQNNNTNTRSKNTTPTKNGQEVAKNMTKYP